MLSAWPRADLFRQPMLIIYNPIAGMKDYSGMLKTGKPCADITTGKKQDADNEARNEADPYCDTQSQRFVAGRFAEGRTIRPALTNHQPLAGLGLCHITMLVGS